MTYRPRTVVWCYKMETFSALLALCEGNPSGTGGFHSQRPAIRDFDVFFDLRLSKGLNKQSTRRWFETPLRSFWRHGNDAVGSDPPWVVQIILQHHSSITYLLQHCALWFHGWKVNIGLRPILQISLSRQKTEIYTYCAIWKGKLKTLDVSTAPKQLMRTAYIDGYHVKYKCPLICINCCD